MILFVARPNTKAANHMWIVELKFRSRFILDSVGQCPGWTTELERQTGPTVLSSGLILLFGPATGSSAPMCQVNGQ